MRKGNFFLSTLLAFCVAAVFVFAGEGDRSVTIRVVAKLSPFAEISSSKENSIISLENAYDSSTNSIQETEAEIALINTISNNKSGYTIEVDSKNNFALTNKQEKRIEYMLYFSGAQRPPKNSTFHIASTNGEKLLRVEGADAFSDSSMQEGVLKMRVKGSKNVEAVAGTYSDTITLTVKQN